MRLGFDGDDAPAHVRENGGGGEVEPAFFGEGVVVAHAEEEGADERDAAEGRGQQGVGRDGDLEDFENGISHRRVGEDEKKVHAQAFFSGAGGTVFSAANCFSNSSTRALSRVASSSAASLPG